MSGLVSDVEGPVPDDTGFIPDIAHIARTNNKPIRLRRISAFLPQQAARYPAELLYDPLLPAARLASRAGRRNSEAPQILYSRRDAKKGTDETQTYRDGTAGYPCSGCCVVPLCALSE